MTQANQIDRRRALAVVAAVPAAVALGAVPGRADGTGGELAALVKRYFEEVDAFNADPPEDDKAFFAKQPYDVTLREMVGVPARTKEDALAALEFMEREDLIETWVNTGKGVSESLVDAIRGYIEGRVA